MRTITIIIFTLLVISTKQVRATETYERKSISYVPITAIISDTVKVPADVQWIFANTVISTFMAMGRWDHNELPESVIKDYRKQAGKSFASESSMRSVIESTVMAEVSGILEANVIERAAALRDESDKKRFISEKAKELGIEEEHIRKIMNSAFVGVPFISAFKATNKDNVLTYSVKGGIAWYSIALSQESSGVSFLEAVEYSHSGSAKTTKTVWDPKAKKNKVVKRNAAEVRADAMRKAASGIAGRIKERTKNLAPFQLKTGVLAVDGSVISFSLGQDEDIRKDDKYYLAEYRLDDKGNTKRMNVGFARVTAVGNGTPEKPTRARVVRSSAVISRGVSLLEHPRTGLETRVAARFKQMKIKQGRLVSDDGTEYFAVHKSQDISLYMVDLGGSYNTVHSMGVSQLFFNLDLMASLHKLDQASLLNNTYEYGTSFILGGSLTMSKKLYVGAFALNAEAGGGLLIWLNTTKFPDSATTRIAEVSVSKAAGAGIAGAALEYAASIDLNIGVSASYWISGPSDSWSLSIRKPGQKEGKDVKAVNTDLPEMDISGLEARVYISYSVL